jgi:hypothetical protein
VLSEYISSFNYALITKNNYRKLETKEHRKNHVINTYLSDELTVHAKVMITTMIVVYARSILSQAPMSYTTIL